VVRIFIGIGSGFWVQGSRFKNKVSGVSLAAGLKSGQFNLKRNFVLG
jgi:hypothetical protein